MLVDGKRVMSYASNDYLGLANHPKVVEAAMRALKRYGLGAGASHMVSGHMRAHHELEEKLAEYIGLPKALLFSSGYAANIGILTALAGRGDTIFADKLNHACLTDGALLSRANFKRYPHSDLAKLDVDKDKGVIIKQILDFGDAASVTWLRNTYTEADIRSAIESSSSSDWSPKSLALWALAYGTHPAKAGRFA